MAQLSDDCFAFSGPLMPVDDVERLIAERVAPVHEIEAVALGRAAGRVLATDMIAAVSLPPFDNSAVDGYAVRHTDLARDRETRLPVANRVTAGRAAPPLNPGEAVRVFTGAPMPAGADTVFMQEDCRVDGASVVLRRSQAWRQPAAGRRGHRGRRARPAGGAPAGAAAPRPGGRDRRDCGDGAPAGAGRVVLDRRRDRRAGIAVAGGRPLRRQPPPDRRDAGAAGRRGDRSRHRARPARRARGGDPRRRARARFGADLGRVSTGEADYVRDAVERVGRLVFWRVAIKPGRPVAMGCFPEQVKRPQLSSGCQATRSRCSSPSRGGAAAAAAAGRRLAGAADRAAGAGGVLLCQEERPA